MDTMRKRRTKMGLSMATMLLLSFTAGTLVTALSTPTDPFSAAATAAVADQYLASYSLRVHEFADTGRGVQTMVDRAPGDILLQVPVGDTITVASTQSILPSDWANLEVTEEQRLSLGLAQMLRSSPSMHGPNAYVQSVLPKQHLSVWTLPNTLWEAPPLSLLPRCYRESFQATRNDVEAFSQSVMDNDDDDNNSRLIWAFSMVRSRSIAVPELAQENDDNPMPRGMIPGLDLFNHQTEAGTALELVDNQWTLTSNKSYQSGDQIWLSYGDDKDNLKLFLMYGFSMPDNNPNAVAFWTWQDVLEAAGEVRPAIFPVRIQQSLLAHTQLQQYRVLSEDRATFSLDTNTKTPRESLQNGLLMLSNLATQLGYPDDAALSEDVLNQLVTTRVEELSNCNAAFSTEYDLPKEWKPFYDYLELLLKEEQSKLEIQPGAPTME